MLSCCRVGVATTSMYCRLVHADDVVLKRAKRDKLLATHPDKLGTETIGANLAVGRVTQVACTSRFHMRCFDAALHALHWQHCSTSCIDKLVHA